MDFDAADFDFLDFDAEVRGAPISVLVSAVTSIDVPVSMTTEIDVPVSF
jgi:hypothetical protein